MSDYIKRDDALNVFVDANSIIKAWHNTQHIPSVDAVEVVRCKDCKHYEYSDRLERLVCGYHRGWWVGMNENDYCSYGERKDNEID